MRRRCGAGSGRRLAGALAVAGAGLLLAACSQTAALAPVGGDRLAEVRFAGNDVLLAHHVRILVAPVCTASGPDEATITCAGEALDHDRITVSSDAEDQDTLTVVVGPTTLYDGSLNAILTKNAQPAS